MRRRCERAKRRRAADERPSVDDTGDKEDRNASEAEARECPRAYRRDRAAVFAVAPRLAKQQGERHKCSAQPR